MRKKDKFKKIFFQMLQTRYLEEAIAEEHRKGTTHGPIHLCIGQEAAGVAACAALEPHDVVCPTHRGHAVYIGKGLSLKKLCCEIWGREEGYGKGRAGHMCIFDLKCGVLGGSGIVGGGIPLAVGQALAFHLSGENKRIAVSFFGDGASNTGSFHESLNMAAKWKLPVIFFCETNQYGLTVHIEDHLSVRDVVDRAKSYDMTSYSVFGNDMVQVYDIMNKAVKKVRAGDGPALIEAKTYRIHGFSTSDTGGYQRESEISFWKERDPLLVAEKWLIDNKIYNKNDISEIKEKALKEIHEAINYALKAPYPLEFDLSRSVFHEGE